jgi:hypothetical protein
MLTVCYARSDYPSKGSRSIFQCSAWIKLAGYDGRLGVLGGLPYLLIDIQIQFAKIDSSIVVKVGTALDPSKRKCMKTL